MNLRRGRTFRRRIKCKMQRQNQHNMSFEERTQLKNLMVWMGKRGFKPVKKLVPAIFPDTGRGLMAKEAIGPGELILKIPDFALITLDSILDGYLGYIFKNYVHKCSALELFCVFLMCEKIQKDVSPWSPYIETLPSDYSTPLFFHEEHIRLLPQELQEKVFEQKQKIHKSYNQIQLLIRDLEKENPGFRGMFTIDFYKWAWFTVYTRCVYKEQVRHSRASEETNNIAMAPFLDLLNHSWEARVKAGYNKSTKNYEIRTLKPYKKYKQVFINYGGHDNRSLLLNYGFVLPDNENDMIPITIEDILLCNFGLTSCASRKLEFMKERNLLEKWGCNKEGVTWNLQVAIKIFISKCHTSQEMKTVLTNILLNKENSEYRQAVVQILSRKLQTLSKSILPLVNVHRKDHLRLVQKLLTEEKLILENAIKQITDN